jgi:DNA-binding MarR family transcriptional regulator
VALTEAGRAARQEAIHGARMLNERLCEGFSDAEPAVVARWLEVVRQKFPRESGK